MAHRTFEAPAHDPTAEPVTFEFMGHVANKEWRERFTLLDEPPAGVLDDLVRSMSIDQRGRIKTIAQASLVQFVRGCLVPEDEDRFDALVQDKVRVVTIEQLADLADWISELMFNRPTVRRAPSLPGSANGGATSAAASSSQDTTPTDSAPGNY